MKVTLSFDLNGDDGSFIKQELERCLKADKAYGALYDIREALVKYRNARINDEPEEEPADGIDDLQKPSDWLLVQCLLDIIDESGANLDDLWT